MPCARIGAMRADGPPCQGGIVMTGDRKAPALRAGRMFMVSARAGVCALVMCVGGAAAEETAQPPPPDPGVFGAIGKWVDDAMAGVTSGIGNARGTLDEAAGRASDTAK